MPKSQISFFFVCGKKCTLEEGDEIYKYHNAAQKFLSPTSPRRFRKHNKEEINYRRVSTTSVRDAWTHQMHFRSGQRGVFFFPGDEEGEMPAFEAVSRPAKSATVCSGSRSGKPSLEHGLEKSKRKKKKRTTRQVSYPESTSQTIYYKTARPDARKTKNKCGP